MNNRPFFILKLLLIIGFIIFVFSLIFNTYTRYDSSSLIPVISKDDLMERIDYKDKSGNIQVASDLGYATKIITYTECGEYEEYFDDKGKAASKNNDYHGLLREFDKNGDTIRITYYDLNMQPCITKTGYAIEERLFNTDHQLICVKYFNPERKPICTPNYGYGKIINYDNNGNIKKTTFLDKKNNPMVTGYGYASIIKDYYETNGADDGKTKKEFYYDSNGLPICLSLGQYGVYKEYDNDGRNSVLTYLDPSGNPLTNRMGFSTVKYYYDKDNKVKTEMYYDIYGNPVCLSEGQYGIKRNKDNVVYLGVDGKEIFNLRNELYNNPCLVISSVFIVTIISCCLNKKGNIILLLIFLICIIYLTLMYRESAESQAKLELFWSYKQFLKNNSVRVEILRNILLFLPLGTILYNIIPLKKVLLFPLFSSLLIEIIQYFFGVGLFEFDDIISNCIGSIIGYTVGRYLSTNITKIKFKYVKRFYR